MMLLSEAPSLHVFISGFGSPHLAEKLNILRNNMAVVSRFNWSRVHYTVCCYDDSSLGGIEHMKDVTVVRDSLIVGQYLKKYLVPNTNATSFTHLLCILDDVELQDDMDWGYMMRFMDRYNIDILSPSMTHDSKYQFAYMLQDRNITLPFIKLTSALEYFCYFMRPSSYSRYYEHINGERNPWMWGLDMLIHRHVGMLAGVINHITMKHWYKNEHYALRPDADPTHGYNYVLERYNETTESLANQPSVLKIIT